VDPSTSDDANKKIASCTRYFPKQEDVFFYGLKAGDTYSIKCWIGETTTVRVR